MYRFAHLSDCHLGAQKQPLLQELEGRAFRMAIDDALNNDIDFMIIAGDLFHSNLPNMKTVKMATRELRRVRDEGIPVYVNYGSHDYSPSHTSMIDILESAGLIENVVRPVPGRRLGLEFTEDEATGARITGLSGRSRNLEKDYYMMLDREALEAEDGFKIFVFHSAITQFKTEELADVESIDLNLFPRGFDYYAGGHVHRRSTHHEDGYGCMVFPGALFGSYARDLEDTARGEVRGYYLVDFSETIRGLEFREIMPAGFEYIEVDVDGITAREAMRKIESAIAEHDVRERVVMLRIRGGLSSGKTSEIDSGVIRRILRERGAITVNINRHGIRPPEIEKVRVSETEIPRIEEKILREKLAGLGVKNMELKSAAGLKMASELLKRIRNERREGETREDYERRMVEDALEVLGLEMEGGDGA